MSGARPTILQRTPLGDYQMLVDDAISNDAFHVMPSKTYRGWAPNVNQFLLDRLDDYGGCGSYLDVGAHIGMTTIPLALARPAVRFYAFEPTPLNRQLLEWNLVRNGVRERVHLSPAAVSDRVGRAILAASQMNTHDHRLVNPATPLIDGGMYDTAHRERLEVDLVTLDGAVVIQAVRGPETLRELLLRPVVLKMDVQGAELAVLRGALDVVRPDIVILEYWPYGLLQAGESLDEFVSMLARWRRGALLVGSEVVLRPGLHVECARMLPWDGESKMAVDLVMEGFAG